MDVEDGNTAGRRLKYAICQSCAGDVTYKYLGDWAKTALPKPPNHLGTPADGNLGLSYRIHQYLAGGEDKALERWLGKYGHKAFIEMYLGYPLDIEVSKVDYCIDWYSGR